jgi:tartrate-resistant acid phosphatase type 5
MRHTVRFFRGAAAAGLLLCACVDWRSVGYYSRVLLDGEKSSVVEGSGAFRFSSLCTFGSESTTVRLLVVGDWGSGMPTQYAVARAMAVIARTERPHAVISTGDNFYPSGVAAADDSLFSTRWERVYADSALHVPWIIALGNHDHRGNVDALVAYGRVNPRWYFPGPYYVTHCDASTTRVAIVVLDTDTMLRDRSSRSQQLRWLDSVLSVTSATVTIVVGHHPIRSYGLYGETTRLLESLKPILDRRCVMLYLCGHEHDVQIIEHPDDRFACVVSGNGGKSRRTRYGSYTRRAWTGGGFVYLACRADTTVVAQVITAQGHTLSCDTLRVHRQGLEPRTR